MLTTTTITDEQIRELRRDTFARWNKGEVSSHRESLNEQLQIETAALHPDGGIVGPPGYHARRITQADARARCAALYSAKAGT